MDDLLFLVHRIPFPPNKGDKVRSHHLLEHLKRRYRVHLGAFVDDPADWRHVDEAGHGCAGACFLPLHPRRARWRSLAGLLSGQALTLPYYRDRRLQRWVDATLASGRIARIVVFSSAMAQYALPHLRPGVRSLIDFVDVDSDKWRQYAETRRWPLAPLYRRESRKLLHYEGAAAGRFGVSVFVAREEAALFRRLNTVSGAAVTHVDNGVDAGFFSPERRYPNPFAQGEDALVFTGAMDYWPNVDAVRWFAAAIFPAIREQRPNARFCIVGARPARSVQALASQRGVRVTGMVDDVRPYLAHARLAVAPLRMARGVQNKVLEAMAMNKPLLATPNAMEGIEWRPLSGGLVSKDPAHWCAAALQMLQQRPIAPQPCPREWVTAHHDWARNMGRMVELLEQGPSALEGEDRLRLHQSLAGMQV